MAGRCDALRDAVAGAVAFGSNHQKSIFLVDRKTLNPSCAIGVEGVCQAQNSRQLYGGSALFGSEARQRLLSAPRQGAAMIAGNDTRQAQFFRAPAQWRTETLNQAQGRFVMALLSFGPADLVQQGSE